MSLTLIDVQVDLAEKCLNQINSGVSVCVYWNKMFVNTRVKSDKQQSLQR